MKTLFKDSKRQRVVLAWSAADVQRHAHQESIVIPLAPEGLIAARHCCGAKVIDTDCIMGAAQDIRDGMRVTSQVVDATLLRRKREPWMAGIILEIVMGHILLWDRLMSGIRQMMDKVPFEIIPPLAFERPSLLRKDDWNSIQASYSFWACLASLERRGQITVSSLGGRRRPGYKKEYLEFLRRTLISAAGYFVIRLRGLLLCERSKDQRSQWPAKADLLLIGLNETDAVHEMPLAHRIAARFGDRFLCVGRSRQEIMKRSIIITPEEEALFDTRGKKELRWISPDEVPWVVWRHPLFARLANSHASWSVAGILSNTVRSSLSRLDWFDCLSNGEFSNLCLNYERWRRFLDAVSPRVISAFSALQDMAPIRSWAREKTVPFVLFPHGVFPSIRSQYHVDGDYLGVFGRIMAEQVQVSGISRAREVALCGSMQFGTKSADRAKTPRAPNIPAQRSLLYVASFSFWQLFPSSVGRRFKELEELHRACRSVGYALVVREHPRGGKGWLGPLVEELERRFPGTVRVSKEPSLFKDVSSAAAVVASEFDGAVLDTLLSGAIVIIYLAEHSWNASLKILEKIGCFVRTENELEHVLRAVLENRKEAAEIRRREQEFLKEYVEDPSGDPWVRAEELLAKVVESARLT